MQKFMRPFSSDIEQKIDGREIRDEAWVRLRIFERREIVEQNLDPRLFECLEIEIASPEGA
jgi:hypothetical protein